MGAFQTGWKLGADAYDSAESQRLARLKEARDAQDFQDRRDELAYQRQQRAGIDQAAQAYRGLLTSGVVDGASADFSQTSPAANAGPVPRDQMAPVVGLAGPSAPAAAAPALPAGAAPYTMDATGLRSRKPSQRDLLSARATLALASKDFKSLGDLEKEGKELDWSEGYLKHGEAWDKLTDDEKGKLIDKLSADEGVRGTGTWEAPKDGKPGYMHYLPPGGKPVTLSAREAKQVYILTNMMQVDPLRARKELDAASDKVAEMARHVFDDATKAAGVANTAVHYQNSDQNTREYQQGVLGIHRAELGLEQQALKDAAASGKMGAVQQMLDDKGNVVLGVPIMRKDGTFEFQQVDMKGLKFAKQGPAPRPSLTDKDYIEAFGNQPSGESVNGKPVLVRDLPPHKIRALVDEYNHGPRGGAGSEKADAAAMLGKTKAPAAPAGGLAPATAPAAQAPARPPTYTDNFVASQMAELQPLAEQFKQARAQFIAAARSGDPRATALYMRDKEDLRKRLEQAAEAKFGNGASQALQTLAGDL